MESNEIKLLLETELADCDITVEGGDGKFIVTAIGDVFQDLNAVKRQQTIYKILNPHIASGAIHAVTMRLMTSAEREAS